MSPLDLYVMPTCWDIPSPSPFVLKLMTWMRMAGVPYQAHVLKGPPKSPTGKVPYIVEADGRIICDSSVIIAHLTQTRGVGIDGHLDPTQRAQALTLQRLLEDHLYWVGVTDRWRNPDGWAHARVGYFGGLPWPLPTLVPFWARRSVLQSLHGQGFGRMTLEQVWARGDADVEALSVLLGEQDFFLGAPSSVDATAYGLLANFLAQPWEGRLKSAVAAQENLVGFVERVRGRWWAE